MCGIAGLFLAPSGSTAPTGLAAIGPMTEQLRHRGPSGHGLWADEAAGIALGHRRLSIIDLSDAGRQPMASHSGRFVISFNGEIYNFLDLRKQLERRGHVFHGGSDTEVLLAACEAWGVRRALQHFHGMFAFALWDRRERILHLARDRMGKKPLYVGTVPDGLAFASELKAFRAVGGFRTELDPQSLSRFLQQGWIGDADCIWADAFKLPPGSRLEISGADLPRVSLEDLRRRIDRWWRLEDVIASGRAKPCRLSEDAATEELDRLLRVSVSQRMISDVPLGALLSGGIDSSVVVALMQQMSARPVKTYTIGFDEGQFDEASQSAQVAAHLGTEHTVFRVTAADALATIPELPEVWDEPFADDSQIPMLLLARLARQDVTVALSGDGGDEAFGGYSRHFLFDRITPFLRLPQGLRHTAAACLTACSPIAWDGALQAAHVPARWQQALRREKIHRLADLLATADSGSWYDRATRFGAFARAGVPMGKSGPRFDDPLTEMMYRDTTEYLPGDILVKVDRASMATALECRAPLLDHQVFAFAWSLPRRMKVRGSEGKWILRQVLRRYVPDRLIKGKRGFDVPVSIWLRGPLHDWADSLLRDLVDRLEGILDREAVETAWAEHRSGRRDRSREIWALTMLAAWMQHSKACPSGAGTRTPGAVSNSPATAEPWAA